MAELGKWQQDKEWPGGGAQVQCEKQLENQIVQILWTINKIFRLLMVLNRKETRSDVHFERITGPAMRRVS